MNVSNRLCIYTFGRWFYSHLYCKPSWCTREVVRSLISLSRTWFTLTSSVMNWSGSSGILPSSHFKAHAYERECLLSKLFALPLWIVIVPRAAPLDLLGEFRSHCERIDSTHAVLMFWFLYVCIIVCLPSYAKCGHRCPVDIQGLNINGCGRLRCAEAS